jgi:hypothetical protein
MQNALRQTVTVKNGGLIEFRSPELQEGTTAEVIVIVGAPDDTPPSRLSDFIGKARGGFTSAAEADEFINRERDAWHS